MSANMSSALAHLNAAMGRQYAIRQDGDGYTLLMPNGGLYPVCGAYAMVVRLVTLTIAANGRTL